MDQGNDHEKLLVEIRDTLREQFEEYRRVTSQSLAIQRRAVLEQQQQATIYKFALVGVVVLVGGFIWYLSRFPVPSGQ
jgi:type VI protein secretion system component VasF